MSLLVLGILTWSLIHFVPSLAVNLRSGLVRRVGLVGYKGIFGLVAIVALLLVVHGWQAAPTQAMYQPPGWGPYLTIALDFLAFVLLFAPYMANSFSHYIRHPQLTGVLFWGIGHLCGTGELRSVVLFAGFSVWALLEIILINRRKGAWVRPATASPLANLRLVLAGAGFFAIFMYLHDWLFGVSGVPYLSP